MPIVINEFEIVTEPPPASGEVEGPGPQPEETAPPEVLRPEDIVRIYQQHRRRMARVWAD
ncbi:MAG: hypothetical protein JW918_12640 [Anaerolineae bacterium]|nr:hypothetical protein [Anaerolineae bacterium]